MSQIAAVWKNGTQHQMTLFCAVVVAGEQTQVLRLFVLPVKSIIVWIVWQHLIYAMDRSVIVKSYEMRDCGQSSFSI